MTGPSPSAAAAEPSSEDSSWVPGRAATARHLTGAGCARETAQQETAHPDLVFGNAVRRVQANPPIHDGDGMQHAAGLDELDQAAPAELTESVSRSNSPASCRRLPGDLRVRACTAASSRRRSRSRAVRRGAGISFVPRSRITPRSAESSAASRRSWRSGALRVASAVARHRSLQNSSW
jgi:hypothetical protein